MLRDVITYSLSALQTNRLKLINALTSFARVMMEAGNDSSWKRRQGPLPLVIQTTVFNLKFVYWEISVNNLDDFKTQRVKDCFQGSKLLAYPQV